MPPRKPPPGIYVREGRAGGKSYEIKWRDGGGRAGRMLTHTYPRLAEAVDARARIQANGWRCDCPRHAPPVIRPDRSLDGGHDDRLTFGAFAERHVDSLTGVGPDYRSRFRREMALHFGVFADRPLPDISDMDAREWIRGCEDGSHLWLRAPLSPVTIRRLLAQVGSVMASAQAEGLVTRNVFRGHRLGRRDRDQHTEMTVLTHHEWAVLQDAIPAGVYRDLATVLIGTGMRWGEATALAVGAIDPMADPPRLHVARAWQGDGDGGYQIGTPKSRRSRRTITFSGAVLDALLPHLAGKRDDELVFTGPKGQPIRNSNFATRIWKPSLERAAASGLTKRPRIHDLRHSYVSWLIAAGLPAPAISRRLGHESVTTTIDRYGHMLPELDEGAVAAMERAMPRQQGQ